jgi:PucR family transcriptional regulator, purine catabolism regulatory protein
MEVYVCMKITLKDILDKNIFDQCTILSGSNNLNRQVDSVSILETPDFENYIIENSLILTTFYPIKNEMSLFKKLLDTLNGRNTAGLIIKSNRYIDSIPEDIINRANELNLPLITLDYDANLSSLFNAIMSEIQNTDYINYNFHDSYSRILKAIYDDPSTKELVSTVDRIEDLDILIYNLKSKKLYYSSETIKELFDVYQNTNNSYNRLDDMVLYTEDVIYENKPIYQLMILVKNDKRHILHNYIEIYKLMILLIHQKKQENILKQNQFLMSFVTNLTTSHNNNSQLIEASKIFKWKIEFPIMLLIFSIQTPDHNKVNQTMIDYIRTAIITNFHLTSEEIRYTYLNNQLLFILNTDLEAEKYEKIKHIYDIITNKYSKTNFKIVYSNPIGLAKDIPTIYALLTDSLNQINRRNLNITIIRENNIRLLNLFKNIDFQSLNDFTNLIIGKLINYQKTNNVPLIETLYKYIEFKFNMKATSEALYIHYNTLRYRLSIIEGLGYNMNDLDQNYFDIYLALYLYTNLNLNQN